MLWHALVFRSCAHHNSASLIRITSPSTRLILALTDARAVQIDPTLAHPQKVTVLKSKVGRPPKKMPKLGQWNSHFTESVMTNPLPRINAGISSELDCLCSAPNAAAATLAARQNGVQALAKPALQSGLGDSIQVAQMQYIELQQRLSTLLALSQIQHSLAGAPMQQPAALAAAAGPPVHLSGRDTSNFDHYLQSARQLPHVVMPHLDGHAFGQASLLPLGSLQLSTRTVQDQELLMAALAGSQRPNSVFFDQLRQIELARQQLRNHLSTQ